MGFWGFVFVFCVLCFVRNTKIDMVCQMTDCAKNVFGVITKKKHTKYEKKNKKNTNTKKK